MKRKDMLKIIIIILIIICIISIVKIKDYIDKTKIVDEVYTQEDLDIIEEEVESYLSDKITPRGMSRLYGNYDGENDLNEIYRSLYKLVNYLPLLSEKIKYDNADSINSYYIKNEKDIKTNLGIENEENFIAFIEYLKNIEYNGQEFIDCQIDNSTLKSENRYFSFNIILNLKDFNNEFKLKVNFANNSSVQPIVYYSIIKD